MASKDDPQGKTAAELNDSVSDQGRTRVIWTDDLDQIFMVALHKLGDKAVPTTLLEELTKLGVEGLTRENVASHLQKFRQKLRVARDVTENPAAVVAKTLTPKAITKNKLKLEAFEKTAGLMNELGDAFTVQGASVKRRRFGDHEIGLSGSSSSAGTIASTRAGHSISASNSREIIGGVSARSPVTACASVPGALHFSPPTLGLAPIAKSPGSAIPGVDDFRSIIRQDPSLSHVPITPSRSMSAEAAVVPPPGGAPDAFPLSSRSSCFFNTNSTCTPKDTTIDKSCRDVSAQKLLSFDFGGLGAHSDSLAGFRWGDRRC